MIRNLKTLGAALFAVLALGAMAAQAASAQDLFTSDSVNEKTILTGENEGAGVFLSEPGGAEVSCEHGAPRKLAQTCG